MSALPEPHWSAEAYLAREREAEVKSQYVDGEIFAMSGASRIHNRISSNLNGLLFAQLRGKPCEVFQSDMRVQVGSERMYTYPDVVVVCGEPQFGDRHQDTLINPTVIVEVLSPSTEKYDRGEKFARYRRHLPTLTDYLLISQDQPQIEHYARQPDDRWLLSEATAPEAVVRLPSVGCELCVGEVYEKVTFRPEPPLDGEPIPPA